MELILDRLTKQYHNKIAVDRISIKLQKGVHGLLGANGAGKTTLMRMIFGVLKSDSGTVTFDGIDFLLYMATLKGLTKKEAKRKANELLEMVSLKTGAYKKIKNYSGGMKQRLGIAQALLNNPSLLVLDEPTAGLDPKERVHFRNIIAEIGRHNIVILSTHIVSDIEHIADNILMMKEGQLIYQGEWQENFGDLEQFYLEQFGADGFHAALQIVFPMSSWTMSVGGAVLVLFFTAIVMSVLYSVAIMVLSELLKNSIAVMAIPVGIMFLTMLVDIPYQFRTLSQIYDLLPTNLLVTWAFWDDRLVSIFGKYLTNFQIAPIIYLMFTVLLFLVGKRRCQKYQIGAR